ncbi:MAG: MoaD/ThiS family protein [Chloroflexi bacterium]|nr:MoaD/ThiS family protein [Chloroflexota bacterium]
MVEVRVASTMLKLTRGAKVVHAEGGTVGEVLGALDQQYPGLQAQVADRDGQVHRFVNVYLNDEDVRYMQALSTPVQPGDVVSILPALAGGR